MNTTLIYKNKKIIPDQNNKIKYNSLNSWNTWINIADLKFKLLNSWLSDNIVCFLFYGSMSNWIGYHRLSDYDFHLVLKEINPQSLLALKDILSWFENFDISVHQFSEIINKKNELIFQNWTQWQYFIHVLAQAETIIWKNFYQDIILRLTEEEVQYSLQFKIKEYLWKIRQMILEDVNPIYFKKYAIRLIKDVLLYNRDLSYKNINIANGNMLVALLLEEYRKSFTLNEIHELLSLNSIESVRSPNYIWITCSLGKIANLINN